MGNFIVFEGCEGSGKSTQARLLFNRLLEKGYPGLLTHEPGGTPFGESIRRVLRRGDHINPSTWLFLFSAARTQLLDEVIRPALISGQTVVCDRYFPSTISYQGYGYGLDLDIIDTITEIATQGLRSDIVVLLDSPPSLGVNRRKGQRRDRFEAEPIDFHERVREGYLKQAKEDPERWLVLDATLPMEEISEAVWGKVQLLLEDM